MKLSLIFLCLLASYAPVHAGVFGWFTESEADWAFVQKTGGLRIGAPKYEVHGTRAVTRPPTLVNSAPHTWKATIVRDGARLHLTVTTALAGKNDELTSSRNASLKKIPPGRYDVYYGPHASPVHSLGSIEIPAPVEKTAAR